MSRLTIAVDRVVALVVAVMLIAIGAAAALWGTDRVTPFTGDLDLGPVPDAAEKTWWPWALGVAGAVLILLALRWLIAHLPQRGTGPVKLTGTGSAGRLVADGGSVTQAAAATLATAPGVRSAHGRMLRERGQIIARIDATIVPDADLGAIAAAADDVSGHLRQVLGRDDLHCQVQLRLARGHRNRTRVH